MRPNTAKLTLEAWRAGPRWNSRLAMLAKHYAERYQEPEYEVYKAALALTFNGEVQCDACPNRHSITMPHQEKW